VSAQQTSRLAPVGNVLLPFSASVFPTLQFASLRDFGDWRPSFSERMAYPLMPDIQACRTKLGSLDFAGLWPQVMRHTMLDVFRAGNIARLLVDSLERPGDVFECGTGPGGLALLLAKMIKARGLRKKVLVFDSFEGLPAPDRALDREYRAGACAYSLERVSALMKKHGVEDVVELRQGWFSETLPRLDAAQRFCFGYIDVDLYASAKDSVKHLYDRLQPGCPLVFDDYLDGSGGVFRALNETARDRSQVVHLGPSCQAFLIKEDARRSEWEIVGRDRHGAELRVPACLEELRRLDVYRHFLHGMRRRMSGIYFGTLGRFAGGAFPKDLRGISTSLRAYLALCRGDELALPVLPLEPEGRLVHVGP
jgi:hypothetical protein